MSSAHTTRTKSNRRFTVIDASGLVLAVGASYAAACGIASAVKSDHAEQVREFGTPFSYAPGNAVDNIAGEISDGAE